MTISEYITKHNLEISNLYHNGTNTDADGWTYNDWTVTIRNANTGMEYVLESYKMGTGLTGEPDLEMILDVLAMEFSYTVYDFEEWADNLGYDRDSRKAERIYNACRDERWGFARAFGPDATAELEQMEF
jgi:hypothetical protein